MTLFETNETKSTPPTPKKVRPPRKLTEAERQEMISRGVVRPLIGHFNAVANTIPAVAPATTTATPTPVFNPAPAP